LEKPYVSRSRRVEAIIVLESKEEELPLVPKSTGDIVPESLNPGVMNTPVTDESVANIN
jgi:hypothetical protein